MNRHSNTSVLSSKSLPSLSPLTVEDYWLYFSVIVPKMSFFTFSYVQTGTFWRSFFISNVHSARMWGSVLFRCDSANFTHERRSPERDFPVLSRCPVSSRHRSQERKTRVPAEDEQWLGVTRDLRSVQSIHDICLKLHRQQSLGWVLRGSSNWSVC